MILELQEGKVCRNPHRVLAFLVICLNPSLAFFISRQFYIRYSGGQTQSNDVNSNSSMVVCGCSATREYPYLASACFNLTSRWLEMTSTVIPQRQIQFALKLEFLTNSAKVV